MLSVAFLSEWLWLKPPLGAGNEIKFAMQMFGAWVGEIFLDTVVNTTI